MNLTNDIHRATSTVPAETGRKNELRWLAIIVLVIMAIKLAVALEVVPRYLVQIRTVYGIGASDNYLSLAKNIAAGNGYRFTPDTTLTLMREPGYPYFLAALLRLFSNYTVAVMVTNILFTSMAAFVVGSLARSVSAVRWVPVAAPILFLLHPGVIVSELRRGYEALFILLLVIFLWLLIKALRTDKTTAFVKAGLALGVASCVRSTALLFPAFLAAYGLLLGGGWASIPRYVWRAALVFACALIVLSPWIIRNELLVGKFIPTASVQGVALQVGEYICTHADGKKTMEDLDQEAAAVRNRMAADEGYRFQGDYYQFFYSPQDELRFNSALGREVALEYLQSPAVFAKCTSENVLRFWFAGKSDAVTLANMCIQLPYLILALVGFAFEVRRPEGRPALVLLSLFVVYTMAVYSPIHAQARYSIPLIPIVSIFAAVPICRMLLRRSEIAPSIEPQAIGP
jgi:hypothetical protein